MRLEDVPVVLMKYHPGEAALQRLLQLLDNSGVIAAALDASVRAYHYDLKPCPASGYVLELYGNRGCVVSYWQSPPYDAHHRYWNCWCGKRDDESGGSAMQLHDPITLDHDQTLRLHYRFLLSGRRKVLRNAEQKRRS